MTTPVMCRLPGQLLRDSGPRVSRGAGRAGTFRFTHTLKRLPGSKSWTPAGGPSVPLRVDTVYLERESHSTGKRLSPTSTLHSRPGPVQTGTCAAHGLRIRGSHDPFLPFVNMPGQLTELRKTRVLTR